MEESPYVPNSIPPTLVVFSQSGYGDAIRMQRPFGSQVSDGKDLSIPNLSSSSFGLRPMESYGGLPAQLVHLQNPFLHPALEARLPFGSAGAFRPVVTSSSSTSTSSSVDERMSVKGLPSAFTAPNHNNRRKLDSIVESVIEQQHQQQQSRSRASQQQQQQQENSYSGGGGSASVGVINLDKSSVYINGSQQRHRSISPANCSPNKGDERDECMGDEREANVTPNSDMTDRSTPEDTQLSKRRRKRGQELGCPVCKMSLRPVDLESHLLSEVEQLMCMSRIRRQNQMRDEPLASSSSAESPNASNKKESPSEISQDSRWETYHRVRANRHSRLRLKTRRRREESGGAHVACPNGDMMDEDEPVDIEGDGDGDPHELDEYEWMGHRRHPRPNSNIPTNYSVTGLNMTTNSRRRDEESDSLEVVVDGDDTSTYGHAQYTESDIQSAIMRVTPPSSAPSHLQDGNSAQDTKSNIWGDEESSNGATEDGQPGGTVNYTMVVHALKTRIRELERGVKSGISHDGNHCLICMDKHKKPVVSISCWHVHCEECWLRTLSAKKLCPQCNMITSPADLRRIFL